MSRLHRSMRMDSRSPSVHCGRREQACRKPSSPARLSSRNNGEGRNQLERAVRYAQAGRRSHAHPIRRSGECSEIPARNAHRTLRAGRIALIKRTGATTGTRNHRAASGFLPGTHSGTKSELASQRIGSTSDWIACVMKSKSRWTISSLGL